MSKLLILDNSAELLSLINFFQEKKQYAVKAFTDTLDMFSEIYNYKPDLLLLDTFFGGPDGRELCRQLRTNRETRHVGILILSSSTDTLKDYKSYYADDFIQKPFNFHLLSDKIRSLLSWIPIRKKALGDSGDKILNE